MYDYNVMTGPGVICFIQEIGDTRPNVAHCHTDAEARAFLADPPFDANLATIGDGRRQRSVSLDEVRRLLDQDWMTYYDPARLWWDVLVSDGAGAIGSNWQPATFADAEWFIAAMTGPRAVADGWQRRHYWPPRH